MLFTRLLGLLVKESATVSRVKFTRVSVLTLASIDQRLRQMQFLRVLTLSSWYVYHLTFGDQPPSLLFISDSQQSQCVLRRPSNVSGNFLIRLRIYMEIPPTPAITDVTVKIMLSVLTLATKNIMQGRFSE